ncbi:MAG TPA: FAD-dependent oxidoreductase, partial [Rhizomicrobium sp.]
MTSKYDFDLFVIGGGSGGVRASRMAARAGARVAIAEEYGFGGTCVIRGCIPKKLFVYASHFGEEFEDSAGFGWTVPERHFDWDKLVANKNKEVARLENLYRENVEKEGVETIADRAEFESAHTVQLKKSGRRVTAERFLVATGGRPSRDMGGVPGAEHCITSDEAFYLEAFPRRIVIAGGGYIAVEFAHIFHGLGSEVTLVYRGSKILRGFDDDMRDAVTRSSEGRGIRVVLDRVFSKVEKRGSQVFAFTDKHEMLEADQVMLAIGR